MSEKEADISEFFAALGEFLDMKRFRDFVIRVQKFISGLAKLIKETNISLEAVFDSYDNTADICLREVGKYEIELKKLKRIAAEAIKNFLQNNLDG
ncbi:MAG: hypothetical protein Q6363_007930 [Candidatus Njordarchaeota archaeon]